MTKPEGKELVWWRLIEAGLGFVFSLSACEAGKKGRNMFWPDGSEWEKTRRKQWLPPSYGIHYIFKDEKTLTLP